MKKIGISTDCMCDLPENYIAANDINVLQFYIHTSTGRFLNGSEITAGNIVEYFGAGNVFLRASVPEPEECREYFEELLTHYDEIVHITASDKIGMSYPNTKDALALTGENAKRVTLINSGSVSTGLGHMVLLAVTLRDSGKSAAEIADACDAQRHRISASFIAPNADYLHRIGYAGPGVRSLCSILNLHPVICTKNGRLTVKAFRAGSYEKAVMRYIHGELRRSKRIDKKQLFITHAGCPSKTVAQVRSKADSVCEFDSVAVTQASVFISSCCGPGAVGVMFVYR